MNILNIVDKDIYFYLALEEYLIKNTNDEWFFLWTSDDCVVCGKHQNIYEEINLPFVVDNNIKLARRLSGGGTVFQDKGNVNFTFILNKQEGKQIDFKKHTKPILQYLKLLGIDVQYSKRNNLFTNNMKISGNAEHVYKNRVLHHGTLLFDTDISKLNNAINTKNNYISKSVKSVRKNVTNISNFTNNVDIKTFISSLNLYVKNYYNESEEYNLPKNVINNTELLVENKYITHNWIFNYNSNFEYNGFIKTKNTTEAFCMKIKNGVIENCTFNKHKSLEENFVNKEYNIKSIETIIDINDLHKLFNISIKELLYCFF
jgi:lipoate-protein ligase A